MSRSRTLTAGRAALIAGASIAMSLAQSAMRDRREVITPQELERRQAQRSGPSRGQRRVVKAKAVRELVEAGANVLVLGHIHPRWLRAEVERLLDLGEAVTAERVEQLRAIGAGRGS